MPRTMITSWRPARVEPWLPEPLCRSTDARALGMLESEMREARREIAMLRMSMAEISRARHEARGRWRAVAFLVPVISAFCAAATLLLRLRPW